MGAAGDDASGGRRRRRGALALLGPGILVAATGVGAGDLATAGFAGAELGVAVAWAVLVGAALKLVVTENLARHQLATGRTVLESAFGRLGWWVWVPFGVYLLAWSYFVGGALISANSTAIAALVGTAGDGWRVAFGVAASVAGLAIAWFGGFVWFERVMGVCAGVMVLVVLGGAAVSSPDLGELARGLVVPVVPDAGGAGLGWTVALMGGVGGTLTIVCYGYWMREAGREDASNLGAMRLDVAIGYGMTALFGVAMLVIAAPIDPEGRGLGLIVNLADGLGERAAEMGGEGAGAVARGAFLIGVVGAVFSSLVGVWQSVPMVFADWVRSVPGGGGTGRAVGRAGVKPASGAVSTRGLAYRGYLVAIAVVPMLSLWADFRQVQQVYAVVGAAFVPGLAAVLLVLNNGRAMDAGGLRNRWVSNVLLGLSLVLAVGLAAAEVRRRLG